MKLGILPLGSHARNRVIPNLPGTGFEVSAILTRNPDRVRDYSKETGAQVFSKADEFFKSDIEAVYISSPNSLHYAHAKQALESGKHVILEKQMTLHFGEAEKLAQLAEEKELVLNIGYHLRFHPAIRDVMKIIEDGEIGNILEVSGKWCGYSASYSSTDPVRDWWHDPDMVGGGSVMGTGVHVLDTVMRICGGIPERVAAWRDPRNEVIDRTFHVDLFYGDKIARALSSRKVEIPDNALRILGTSGFLEVTAFFGVDVHSALFLNGESKHEYGHGNMYNSEFLAFNDSINGKPSNIATAREGADVVRVVNAAVESIENDRIVNPSALSP